MGNPITSELRRILFSVKQNFPHLKPKKKNPPPSQLPLPLSVEPRPEPRAILTPRATTRPRPAVRDCAQPRATAQPRKSAESRAIAAKPGRGSAWFRRRDLLLARSRGEEPELG